MVHTKMTIAMTCPELDVERQWLTKQSQEYRASDGCLLGDSHHAAVTKLTIQQASSCTPK